MSQQYICASLVKIYPFLQKTGCRQVIFQHSKPPVTLKMGSRLSKCNQFISLSHQYIYIYIWSKSVSFFWIQGADKLLSNILGLCVTLKMGWRSPNLTNSCQSPNNISMQVCSKSIHTFRIQSADKPFSNYLRCSVTSKMGSRSPKSNQFLSVSNQYICTSLVKIHLYLFLQETECRQAIFQQSEMSCDLENGVKVTKI